VWENLTRAEAEWHGTLAECAHKEFSDMSIMLIRTLAPMDSQIEPPPALTEVAK
jgi:cobalt-precorrin-7 (C5)-methyltransferase